MYIHNSKRKNTNRMPLSYFALFHYTLNEGCHSHNPPPPLDPPMLIINAEFITCKKAISIKSTGVVE